MQGTLPQVYYSDATNGVLRGASLVNGVWTWEATIDGGPWGSMCQAGGGATSHKIDGPVSAVVKDGGPHLFFQDATTGDLRTAYWY
jgi:hypothetical protein